MKTPLPKTVSDSESDDDSKRVFEVAAQLFSILSTPMRLRILSAVCEQEKSVSQLLDVFDTTQPNLSQHLLVLYQAGVLAKRKVGTQVLYRVQSEKAVQLCRSVCTQVAIELNEDRSMENTLADNERLLHRAI